MTTNQAKSLADKYRAKQEALKTRGGQDYDKLWATLQDGPNRVRFFPNPTDGGFYLEGGTHRNLNLLGCVDGEGKPVKAALCPTAFDPKAPCPICELLKTFKVSKDVKERGLHDKCRAKERYFSWVRILSDPSEDSIPAGENAQVLGYGSTILGDLLSYWTDPDYGDFTDPEEGRTATIEKSGTGLDTEYTTKLRPKASSFDAPDLQPLEEVIAPRSYEELEALLGLAGDQKKPGKAAAEDDDEDTGKAGKGKAPAKAPQQARLPLKGKGAASEDDDDERKADPEEQEERQPAKAPARAPRRAEPPKKEEPPAKTVNFKAHMKANPDLYEEAPTMDGAPDGAPGCFGEKFQPRAAVCVDCPVRGECKEVFLST